MRSDPIVAVRLAGCALGLAALAACNAMGTAESPGETSTAPAVTGQNSSATAPAPPNESQLPPQTDVTEQKTGPK